MTVRLNLPIKAWDSWWTSFLNENMDTMVQLRSQTSDSEYIDIDAALLQWGGKFRTELIRYPDGSSVRDRFVEFDNDEAMSSFILRWVK